MHRGLVFSYSQSILCTAVPCQLSTARVGRLEQLTLPLLGGELTRCIQLMALIYTLFYLCLHSWELMHTGRGAMLTRVLRSSCDHTILRNTPG